MRKTAPHMPAALAAATKVLTASVRTGQVPVLLVPTMGAVSRVRRHLSQGELAFGARVETLDAWIADRWELAGDGRRLVDAGERTLLMQRALCTVPGEALDATPGTVALLAGLARDALPFFESERAGARAAEGAPAGEPLTEAEQAVCATLRTYALLLAERASCEVSQAAVLLADALGQVPSLVLLGFDELPCAQEALIEALAQRTDVVRIDDMCATPDENTLRAPELEQLLDRLFKPSAGVALEPRGTVRFLLPAGRYAQPLLVAREVEQAVARECAAAGQAGRASRPVVVAARDARMLFDAVSARLARSGVSAAVSARVTFADTAFGRAFLALLAFAHAETYEVSQATDFALSPFSGMSQTRACSLDAQWRADRTVDRACMAADLAEASSAAEEALGALGRGDLDAALASFESRLRRRSDLDAAYLSLQLAAISSARRFVASAAQAGVQPEEALPLLEGASVSANARVLPASSWCVEGGEAVARGEVAASGEAADGGGNAGDSATAAAADSPTTSSASPDVRFMSLAEAAEQPVCSCAELVLCDLTASAYPVLQAENGATMLLDKLGLGQLPDPLKHTRQLLFRALSTACDAVVCERPLNTVDADTAYPAVMLEELLDCYRADPTSDDDLDRVTGLPELLLPFTQTMGEDELHAITALDDAPVYAAASWQQPEIGSVSADHRPLIVLPMNEASPLPQLSPSALESYLECPYKWFSLRRLRLSEPDAGFGPLEMGSFSHSVLKSFYTHFREEGHAKVTPENMPRARALLEETFDRHLAFQHELRRGQNALIARTAFEQTEADDLKRKLLTYLDRECELLPGFAPAYLEFAFGSDEPFNYAGALLRGSVDRIDVNAQGQAVVIDYKGSVSRDYALASASPAAQAGGALLPHKIQTLVYAQVARRLLGLDVVGAIYVSYGRDARITGAFDRMVLGAEALPGIDVEACGAPGAVAMSFGELVDATEASIALAIEQLVQGDIAPCPRGGDPCGYCPVLACERRGTR